MKRLIKLLCANRYLVVLIAAASVVLILLPAAERAATAWFLAIILLVLCLLFFILDFGWLSGIRINREKFDSFGKKHLLVDRIYLLRPANNNRQIITTDGSSSRIPLRGNRNLYLLASFYCTLIEKLFPEGKIPGKVLVLGGAGCSIPHKLVSDGAAEKVTTVEICPEMIRIAHRYFLAGVEDKIDLIHADAREFVDRSNEDGEYDFIFSDIFLGSDTPLEDYSSKYIENLHRLLSNKGMIYVNLGWKDRPGISRALAGLLETFSEVHVILKGKQFFAVAAKPGEFAERLKTEAQGVPNFFYSLKK